MWILKFFFLGGCSQSSGWLCHLKKVYSQPPAWIITSTHCMDIITSLVKQCSDELLPIITKIINSSLSAGHFPSSFKTAEVIPLLKKSALDPESLQSYCSVSNLKFISKATEKAAIEQLQHYLTDNDLFPHLQSAYRKHHSCETALLRVLNPFVKCGCKKSCGSCPPWLECRFRHHRP